MLSSFAEKASSKSGEISDGVLWDRDIETERLNSLHPKISLIIYYLLFIILIIFIIRLCNNVIFMNTNKAKANNKNNK